MKRQKVRRVSQKWATVTTPKAGPVKFRLTRLLADVQAAKSARITMSPSGQWHISFTALPKDWIEKTTTELVRGYDFIAIEDLKIQNMVRAPASTPDPRIWDHSCKMVPPLGQGSTALFSQTSQEYPVVCGRPVHFVGEATGERSPTRGKEQ